jgi:zeta-carotene desaturase
VVIGAGLAGLAAATALSERGFAVTLLERKSIPGGRASSYDAQDTDETVDNCQHVAMRCCTNLLDFYERTGVSNKLRWIDRLHFLEPNGRASVLSGNPNLPAPFHLLPSFFRLQFLSPADKWSLANALMRMLRSTGPKPDVPMMEWLRQTRQTSGAIERFWRPILVSALNEEPELCSARYAFQVFRQGFLSHPRAYEMGVPSVPLRELYAPGIELLQKRGAEVHFRSSARAFLPEGRVVRRIRTDQSDLEADYVISAVPQTALGDLLPATDPQPWRKLETVPISAVHFWWDRTVTEMDHAALLDRQVQWMFNKTRDFARGEGGTYMGLVVSASRDWLPMARRDILAVAEKEIRETFPGTKGATIVKSAVIKEANATFRCAPGVDALRPPPETPFRNLFLAGDWVQNGWPSTMEAAVRSGYQAAERVLAAEGRPEPVLLPDLPWQAVVGRPT